MAEHLCKLNCCPLAFWIDLPEKVSALLPEETGVDMLPSRPKAWMGRAGRQGVFVRGQLLDSTLLVAPRDREASTDNGSLDH